ncbi:MAG: hypothetical protein WC284_06330 [Candidimonas sp.]
MIKIHEMIQLIKSAHDGQMYGDRPYWTHPRAVMDFLGAAPDEVKIAALGHDLFEDTTVTVADLKTKGVPYRSIWLIRQLARRADETYKEYIERLIATSDRDVLVIKRADLMVNLNGCTERQRRRYELALAKISMALADLELSI